MTYTSVNFILFYVSLLIVTKTKTFIW